MGERGAGGPWAAGPHRPENSLSAFEAAAAHGYAIECDLQMSADGTVFVFHDRTLDRMTNLKGFVAKSLADDMRAATLERSAETVPTLTETLALVAGRVPLILELKGEDADPDLFVQAVAKALEGYEGAAAVMSFSTALTDRFRDGLGGWPRGLTAEGDDRRHAEHTEAFERGKLHFVSYAVDDLPCRFVAELLRREVPVITWTVRTPEQVAATKAHANQMTFEGFLPPVPPEPKSALP